MEYSISAFRSLLELVIFHYFLSAFLVAKTTMKIFLLSLVGAWILPTIYTLTGLNADYGRIISFTFVTLVCIFNFRGPILQKLLFIILPYLRRFIDRDELINAIEYYIYFYNRARFQKRLHSMTPMEFHYAYAA